MTDRKRLAARVRCQHTELILARKVIKRLSRQLAAYQITGHLRRTVKGELLASQIRAYYETMWPKLEGSWDAKVAQTVEDFKNTVGVKISRATVENALRKDADGVVGGDRETARDKRRRTRLVR